MANYAIQTDLEAQYGSEQVLIASDRDGSGTADTGAITAALTAASQEIDSYLAVRYDLPLESPPTRLTDVCCDIAMYRLSGDAGSGTEDKEDRYDKAVKWLTMISKGYATLGTVEETESVQDEAEISTELTDRLFTRDLMGGLF